MVGYTEGLTWLGQLPQGGYSMKKPTKKKCECWSNQCCDICTGWAAYVKKHGHPPEDKVKGEKVKRILHLTLLRRWFDEIVSGRKTREYRTIKPYWYKRLSREYDEVWFRNGYSKGMPFMRIEWKGCTTEKFEGQLCFAIILGKILELRNYQMTCSNCGGCGHVAHRFIGTNYTAQKCEKCQGKGKITT